MLCECWEWVLMATMLEQFNCFATFTVHTSDYSVEMSWKMNLALFARNNRFL